jgi:hypothetical protein
MRGGMQIFQLHRTLVGLHRRPRNMKEQARRRARHGGMGDIQTPGSNPEDTGVEFHVRRGCGNFEYRSVMCHAWRPPHLVSKTT